MHYLFFVYLPHARQTTWTDFSASNMRSALHRVPDLSLIPRDGRGVSADPIRISAAQRIVRYTNQIRYSARRIEGRIRRLRRCRRGHATSPGIGVKPSFYLTRSTSSQVVCSEGARKNPAPVFFCLLAACAADDLDRHNVRQICAQHYTAFRTCRSFLATAAV